MSPGDDAAAVQALRTAVGELLGTGRVAEARPLLEQLLEAHPADVKALNQMASVCEHAEDRAGALTYSKRVIALDPTNTIAMNRLHRLGGPRPLPPPPSHGDDALGVWSWEEAFPYVDAILSRMTEGHDDWVLWTDVRDALLTDDAASLVIEEWARQARKLPVHFASEVMAGWNASITVGSDKNPYKDSYCRRADMNAYRRKP